MIVKYEQQQSVLEGNAEDGYFADQLAGIQSMTPEEIAEAGATQEEFDSYVEAYQLLNSIRRFSDVERIPDGSMTVYGKNYIDGRLQNMNEVIYDNGNDIRELKRYQAFSYDETNQELIIHYHCFPANTATTIDIDFTYQDSSTKHIHDIVYIGNNIDQIKSDILQFEFFAPNESASGDRTIRASLNNIPGYEDYANVGVSVSCWHCFYNFANRLSVIDQALGNDVVKSAHIYDFYPNVGYVLVIEFSKFPENRIMYLKVDYNLNNVEKQCNAQFVFGKNETEKFLNIDTSITFADFT